ncbi:MAG TPA: GDSL-type esterase/lipase family protein [Gemmatimonadaceae bacterium]
MSGVRYLALGDSYTIGEGVTAADRWPVQLAAALRRRGMPMADPEIIARSGWTCDELASGIAAAAPRGPYPLVSLLIGVNDQFRGATPHQYAPCFEALLRQAASLAGGRTGRVIVLSIPDWGVSPFADGRDRFAIAESIDAFNRVNRAASAAVGARYVDVTASSRAAADRSRFVADGLHPSAGMYAEWAALALDAAVAALRV